MTERRMFARPIIDSDLFLDMPLSAQCLYFHLAMRADDDGFIDNAKRIRRMIGASDEDFKELIDKRYIFSFESGVVVIRHWKAHNYIRTDRYRPSTHAERELLIMNKEQPYELKEKACNQVSTTCLPSDYQVTTTCLPSDYQVTTNWERNDAVGEVRLGKVRLGNIAAAAARTREGDKPQDVDEDLGACLRLFEDNIHPITGEIERDKLLALYDKYHREWLAEAIREAATSNGRSIKYIERILERWERDGFKKRGSGHGGTAENLGKGKRKLTPEEERAKWDSETPGWD